MSRECLLARPKSRLEDLPAELIQEIFLRCLEINLPCASVYLARALSDVTIYTWLVRLAFTKVEGEGEAFLTHFLPPRDVVGYLDIHELKQLRTRILQCRWCTLPLIRSCQLALLNHVLRYERPNFKIIPDDRHLLSGFENRFNNLEACNKANLGNDGEGDLILRAKRPGHHLNGSNPERSLNYKVAVGFNYGIIEVLPAEKRILTGRIYFELPYCEDSYIPDKLLHPPWTREKLEFLRLVSSRATLDTDTEFHRATRTLRNLIRARDCETFARLLDMNVRIECYAFPVLWPTNNTVFRAALKYADRDDDLFVRLLVEERWDHIEPEDIGLKERLLKKVQSREHPCEEAT